jgi:hypothetical protein
MMSDNKSSRATRMATVFLFMICVSAASSWCLDRFMLYHGQNRVLQPSDYTVSVVPAASRTSRDARLSDDGRFAVKVMTVGTSHAMNEVTNSLLQVFSLGVFGLVCTWYVTRRRNQRPV